VTNAKTELTGLARAHILWPGLACSFLVVGMQERDMGVVLCANVDAETQGMISRKTKVIGSSFIHEGEAAGRSRVPGISRNHIKNGLQLRHEFGPFFGLPPFIDVDSYAIPLDDASLSIT